MQIQHIALVPETDQLDASQLARVSAALQKQVLRDVLPIWQVGASVDAFPHFEDVPAGYWPIVLTYRELGDHAGIHIDRNGQPFAQVQAAGNWSVDASRACLELLINPFENRTVSARSPRPDQGPVEYLIEVSSPCAGANNGYAIDDVLVADFCTPAFFAPRPSRHERYSFNDSVGSPLQLLPSGHLTWFDPTTRSWWLRSYRNANPIDTELGSVNRRVVSLRELIQACTPQPPVLEEPRHVAAQSHAQRIRQAGRQRAQSLRAELERESGDNDDIEEIYVQSVPPPLPTAAARARATPDSRPNARSVATPRARRETGALIAGGALAGAAVFALGLAARGPLTATRGSERPVAAAVVSAPLPAAPAAVTTPPVTTPLATAAPATTAAVEAVAAVRAKVQAKAPAVSGTAPALRGGASMAPHSTAERTRAPQRPRAALPSPAPAANTALDTAGVDDSLDALIGTRN